MVHVARQAVATRMRQLQRESGQDRRDDGQEQRDDGQDRRDGGHLSQAGRGNLRIALILASIALVFFASVIANRILFN